MDGLKGLGMVEQNCLGRVRQRFMGSDWAAGARPLSTQALGDDTRVPRGTPGRARRGWGEEMGKLSPGRAKEGWTTGCVFSSLPKLLSRWGRQALGLPQAVGSRGGGGLPPSMALTLGWVWTE